jgi:hypothetical protein
LKRRFKRLLLVLDAWVYKNLIERYLNDLKDNVLGSLGTSQILESLKNQEPSNIWEDELPGDSIERTLKFLDNSIGKIQKSQENIHGDSTKEFISCCDAPFPSPPIPSMDFTRCRKREVPKEGDDCIESL